MASGEAATNNGGSRSSSLRLKLSSFLQLICIKTLPFRVRVSEERRTTARGLKQVKSLFHGGGGPQVRVVTRTVGGGGGLTRVYKQPYNPAIPGCTFSKLLNGC